MSQPFETDLVRNPALQRLLGSTPAELHLLGGGGNSRVYRVLDAGGGSRALKVYFRHPGDHRDRLGTEVGALRFLWSQGLRPIPQVLGADPDAGFALYEFIRGVPPVPVTEADVDHAARFLGEIHALRHAPEAQGLPEASEACFSLEALARNIDARLRALEEGAPALAGFLATDLRPQWQRILGQARERAGRDGVPFAHDLTPEDRTLSPSDFGFHNALRRDGRMVYLDFEYFGWDDPAKLASDILLHPGTDLSSPLRQRLVHGLLATHRDGDALSRRIRVAHPMFAIKWCLIMLNEFLPSHLDRRRFAAPDAGTIEQRQARQLAKARETLNTLRADHEPLP